MAAVISATVLAVTAASAFAFGHWRWNVTTNALRGRLEHARLPPTVSRFSESELADLPAPVQRYFSLVLKDGQPIITAASFRHGGTFNMSETAEQWKPFTSSQRVTTRRAGFDWDARIMMLPGVPVHVRDAYVAGGAVLYGALFGLIPVVHLEGTQELAQGELMRFLVEAAWYPTALLPSQGVQWAAEDDASAHAIFTDGKLTLTLLFHFGADGLIDTVTAKARGRLVDGKTTMAPWQGRFWNYAVRSGMTVPLNGEVAWLLPEGRRPYFRALMTGAEYEFAQ